MNCLKSELHPASGGVPQGPVIGPILFLLFINNMSNCIHNCCFSVSDMTESLQSKTVSLFADDTVAISAVKTEELLLTSMKDNVDRLHSWLRVNRLKINLGKAKFVIFSRSPVFYHWINEIVTHCRILKRALSIKYLGVYIDEILSFKFHAQSVSKILSRNLGIMRKLKQFFLFMPYASFIFPLSIHIFCIVVVFGLVHLLLLPVHCNCYSKSTLLKRFTKKELGLFSNILVPVSVFYYYYFFSNWT